MRSRLSFANVTSSIALFIALGGGAYAATTGSFVSSSGAIRGCVKHSGALIVVKTTRQCPHGTVTLPFNQRGLRGFTGARGPDGKTGATGKTGPTGKTGSTGANGKNGEPGAPGSALGYATVAYNGTETVVTGTKNVTSANVTRPKPGVFCFHGLPFAVANVQATLGFTGGQLIQAQAPGAEADCGEAGNQAEVATSNEGKLADESFMVAFN